MPQERTRLLYFFGLYSAVRNKSCALPQVRSADGVHMSTPARAGWMPPVAVAVHVVHARVPTSWCLRLSAGMHGVDMH